MTLLLVVVFMSLSLVIEGLGGTDVFSFPLSSTVGRVSSARCQTDGALLVGLVLSVGVWRTPAHGGVGTAQRVVHGDG